MISVRTVGYTYPKAVRPAIEGLDFAIGRGQAFGLVGPAGAGKTTALKILVGLIRDYTGSVDYQGKELKEWSRDVYETLGVSFATPNLFAAFTAKENLDRFGRLYSADTGDIPALLESVGLDAADGRPVGRYSRDMQARLSLARALLHRPAALFLDEPAAALDPAQAGLIRDLILRRKQAGLAVFLTTRDMAFAEGICDRIAPIAEGAIR